jgi:hypothetical protein
VTVLIRSLTPVLALLLMVQARPAVWAQGTLGQSSPVEGATRIPYGPLADPGPSDEFGFRGGQMADDPVFDGSLPRWSDPLGPRAEGPQPADAPQTGAMLHPGEQPIVVAPGMSVEEAPWRFQFLPAGLIYRSYLAGEKEPRLAAIFNHEERMGWIWDMTIGARIGMFRYGTENPILPEGWQLDFEGASMLRIDPESDRDVVSSDYRFGLPLTYGEGPFRTKFGYYHISCHLLDEFMLRHPGVFRDNYVRDALVLGESWYLTEALRLYAEVAYAFNNDGRAKPWEFQFGLEYSPILVNGLRGAPFFAINGHLREEFNYSGNLVVQTGWQWRSSNGQLFRLGVQYYAGQSEQWEFADEYEEKFGAGFWYDF